MASKYDLETKERVLRFFAERRAAHPDETLTASFDRVHSLVGVPVDTVRTWVRRAAIDAGDRPGVTTVEHEEMKRLRRENAELKRANEILKTASLRSTCQRNSALSLSAGVA